MKTTETRMFLDRAGVDRASEQMVCWLVELDVPGRDALRIRLMMEELLLNILLSNPIRPFSDGNTLQIIFLAAFLGVILLGMCCVDNNLEPTGFYGIMQMSLI